jgi:hypothetical protein
MTILGNEVIDSKKLRTRGLQPARPAFKKIDDNKKTNTRCVVSILPGWR